MKNAKAKTARTRTPRRDRVRGRRRRGSTSTVDGQVRQLDEAALASYGFDRATIEKAPPPDLAFHFGLVEHGYELRLFEDGQYAGVRCRDFSGNHTVADLKAALVKAISGAVDTWRKRL